MKWHNRTLREMTSIKKRPVIQVCRKNTVRVGGSCSCKDPEVRPVCCPEETAEWLKALGRSRQAGHTAEPCGNLAKSCSPHYCVDVHKLRTSNSNSEMLVHKENFGGRQIRSYRTSPSTMTTPKQFSPWLHQHPR